MTGDGNCLFHALANQTGEDGVQLRSEIIQFLEENAAYEDDEEQIDAWLEEAEYLRDDPSHWGGDTAIVAFTRMRQQRVILHSRAEDGQIETIDRTHLQVAGAADGDFVQGIHLWYNGRDHYDVLVPSHELAPPREPPRPDAASPPPPPPPHPEPRPPKRSRTATSKIQNKPPTQASQAAAAAAAQSGLE